MKVLCSQEVVSPPRCEVVSCQVTAKASAPQVPWFVLCWWLQQGIREDRVWYKPIDFYALSCSSFRKSTRNLIEIAQRKSQITATTAGGMPIIWKCLSKPGWSASTWPVHSRT